MHAIEIDEAWEVVRAGSGAGVLVTCEHASQRLPEPWRWSARDEARLVGTHWAYDLGAAELAREYAAAIGGVAVLSRFSRLLADPNRPEGSPTLFRDVADGERVELNASIDPAEREIRLDAYYRPFHAAVDREVAASHAPILLAMHTFTPLYEGTPRALEIGVLFDEEEALAAELIDTFAAAGLKVAPNEPYSGRAGLIHVVDRHARTHGRRAIELEVRQDLAVDPAFRARFVSLLASRLR
ncbi:N-formylglutamate amidohydrolase [Sandaracinus amylolyticus]|uniref:N-formylglutamate amidohydrolase n=1 Tax=Sandaracinus amylolyticus TaxID=927083 RepID=UPI001F470CAB|nr:N-formylglutamate amidohydrolase [Sandaracinus amylolyticus]UJR79004.1 putative N-formylglutamate amidohydrolase [Sandaracinus amylolyticus]